MKASENPFRSSRVEQIRYDLSSADLSALVDTAISLNQSCLLGPHGTGKTTLLEDIGAHLKVRGIQTHLLQINTSCSKRELKDALESVNDFGSNSFCLFDGAEVLSLPQYLNLLRRARRGGFGLIATLHRRSVLPVLYRTSPNWELTEQFVRELACNACDSGLIEEARLAFKKNNGNIREVFRACYLEMARRKST